MIELLSAGIVVIAVIASDQLHGRRTLQIVSTAARFCSRRIRRGRETAGRFSRTYGRVRGVHDQTGYARRTIRTAAGLIFAGVAASATRVGVVAAGVRVAGGGAAAVTEIIQTCIWVRNIRLL